jgi:hypothetical protein
MNNNSTENRDILIMDKEKAVSNKTCPVEIKAQPKTSHLLLLLFFW